MPIQQHPLPQDISSYKFRLIGDMTIRQFIFIASFIVLTILIHNSFIPFFFRYPLEILTLGMGIGLAFVPVQGRPLDQWIVAFIRSIYSPTQYTWKQSKQEHLKTSTQKTEPTLPTPPQPNSDASKTKEPLSSSGTTLDLTKGSTPKEATPTTSPLDTKPKEDHTPTDYPSNTKNSTTTKKNLSIASPSTSSHPSLDIDKTPVAPTRIPSPQSTQIKTSSPVPSTNLPIPFTPERPNTIVGLTLTPPGLILDGVLIEIISKGLTIRATKSNRLGQFLFAKALENGLYQIKAEKDDFKFTTYSITLEGRIIKPLKIQAKT